MIDILTEMIILIINSYNPINLVNTFRSTHNNLQYKYVKYEVNTGEKKKNTPENYFLNNRLMQFLSDIQEI